MDLMQDVASGAVSALEEEQDANITQVYIKQEVPDEGEGVNDGTMHSESDDIPFLQNQVHGVASGTVSALEEEQDANITQVYIKQEAPDEGDDAVHSVLDDDPLLQTEVDVKDEEVTIEEGPPFAVECILGEASQGEPMIEVSCVKYMGIARSEVEDKDKGSKCLHCGEMTETKEQTHIAKAHGFGGEERRHLEGQSEGKKYICSVCDKGFTKNSHLARHVHIHLGLKPYECNACELTFTQKGSLKAHMRMHSGDRPYSCSVCESRFSRKHILNIRMRIHSGVKPFKCCVCEKVFRDKSSFNRHKRIHTGDRPYKCYWCEKRFSDSSSCSRHKKIHTKKQA